MIETRRPTRRVESPEQLVAAAPELEALPVVAQRLLAMLRDEHTTVAGIASLLGTDQALASAVLRQANSGLAMPNRRIADLREAVARIGQRTLWSVLISACAGPMLDRGLPPYGLARRVAWRHAATTSVAARQLAQLLDVANPEEAGVAGLLHDVGKTVLTWVAPTIAASAVALARGQRLQVWQAEERLLGFNHGAVGAALVRCWGLPEAVVEAVAHHHDQRASSPDPANRLTTIVYLADAAAHAVGAVGGGGACPQPAFDMPAAEALGARPAEIQQYLESLKCVEEGDLCA